MSAPMTSCLSRTRPFVCGFLCLFLIWFKAYAVDPISWQLPPQDISVADQPLMRDNFDMNNLGQAAVIYRDNVSPNDIKIAIKDKGGAWMQTLPAGNTTSTSMSLNIGINNQGNLLAVWSKSNDLYYATANFDDLMLGGSWTITPVTITGSINVIQSFDFNNAGEAIIFRSPPGTPHVFNGTSWDNTDNAITFGTAHRPTAAINNSGQIIAIWADGDTGPLRYRTRTVGGSWSAEETLTSANISTSSQTLSLNNSGQAVASWVDDTSGNMRIATFTFGDASWTVLSEASTVNKYSVRALINDNGRIASSWYDGSDLQARTGPFATPLANGTQLSTKFGYVGALRDDGIAVFVLTTSAPGTGYGVTYGRISAVTFDASDLSFSAETLLSVVDVEVFFSKTFFFKAATNNRGDWLVLWMRNSDQMLKTSYSSPTILSVSGKQITARYATCKEHINCLYLSVSTNENLSFFRIYRDDHLIGTFGVSEVLEFDDRERKKELPHRYTIEAINQGGSVCATTTFVFP
ncbi:MAG: hypothetical protein K1000chlam1_01091 [Candidatus Anoxychlamydiales bacterium]|nr:hypothetical protein [Candidatus Anoxychlamydiales bacterium]